MELYLGDIAVFAFLLPPPPLPPLLRISVVQYPYALGLVYKKVLFFNTRAFENKRDMHHKMPNDSYKFGRHTKAGCGNTDRKMMHPSNEGSLESVPSISISGNIISYFIYYKIYFF